MTKIVSADCKEGGQCGNGGFCDDCKFLRPREDVHKPLSEFIAHAEATKNFHDKWSYESFLVYIQKLEMENDRLQDAIEYSGVDVNEVLEAIEDDR